MPTMSTTHSIILLLFRVRTKLLTLGLSAAFGALVGAFAAGLLTLLLAGSLAWKIYDRDSLPKGIVLEQKVDVLSGPGAENITVCTIHEGIKVRVHDSSSGWYRISLPNGWNGWLPQNSVGIL